MKNKIEPAILKKVLGLINARLPKRAKVLCLSLAGSRALGLANEGSNYEIYGIFACKNYWDQARLKKSNIELNLYELEYIFDRIEWHLSFEFFQNIANPIHLDPKFDYKGLLSLYGPGLCQEPIREIKMLENHELSSTPQTALQCYRALMIPIHFLRTGKFELNIFKLNKRYHFRMLPALKEAHLATIESRGRFLNDQEKKTIKQDLDGLLKEFRALKEKTGNERRVDYAAVEKWREKAAVLWT